MLAHSIALIAVVNNLYLYRNFKKTKFTVRVNIENLAVYDKKTDKVLKRDNRSGLEYHIQVSSTSSGGFNDNVPAGFSFSVTKVKGSGGSGLDCRREVVRKKYYEFEILHDSSHVQSGYREEVRFNSSGTITGNHINSRRSKKLEGRANSAYKVEVTDDVSNAKFTAELS